jgi:Arc/MetJ-type ribon-helix-helix transcriptional regulator
MKSKKILLLVDDAMKGMIDELKNSGGYFNQSDVIRTAIRNLYKKEFPNYVNPREGNSTPKNTQKRNDPEGYCKRIGGEYRVIDGQDACVVKEGLAERIKFI